MQEMKLEIYRTIENLISKKIEGETNQEVYDIVHDKIYLSTGFSIDNAINSSIRSVLIEETEK